LLTVGKVTPVPTFHPENPTQCSPQLLEVVGVSSVEGGGHILVFGSGDQRRVQAPQYGVTPEGGLHKELTIYWKRLAGHRPAQKKKWEFKGWE